MIISEVPYLNVSQLDKLYSNKKKKVFKTKIPTLTITLRNSEQYFPQAVKAMSKRAYKE